MSAYESYMNPTTAPLPTRPCSHCRGSGKERDPWAIGEEMRTLREASGKSLREVAVKMKLSAPYLSDLERGNRTFSDALIAKYRRALA
jgi:hypothetical protein